MKSAACKDIVREIKNSRNRFLAIMVLSALAVAFLCGLKVTAPDMKSNRRCSHPLSRHLR